MVDAADGNGHRTTVSQIIQVTSLIAAIVWGVYLFSNSLGDKYVTDREYRAQTEDIKGLVRITNERLDIIASRINAMTEVLLRQDDKHK